MTRLSRKQHDLASVMPLVRHEVCEDMHNIYGQIQPRDSRRWDLAAVSDTEFEQFNDPATTSLQRRQQFFARHRLQAHSLWYSDAVSLAQHLDPHAAGIVNMASDRAHGAPGCARDLCWPQFGWQGLEQEQRYAIARLPSCDDRIRKIKCFSHLRMVSPQRCSAGSLLRRALSKSGIVANQFDFVAFRIAKVQRSPPDPVVVLDFDVESQRLQALPF
jgi:hypothetical protein